MIRSWVKTEIDHIWHLFISLTATFGYLILSWYLKRKIQTKGMKVKQIVKGELAAEGLSYEVDIDAGVLKVDLSVDLGADAEALEAKIGSPLLKSLVEMGIIALKEV